MLDFFRKEVLSSKKAWTWSPSSQVNHNELGPLHYTRRVIVLPSNHHQSLNRIDGGYRSKLPHAMLRTTTGPIVSLKSSLVMQE